MAGAAHLVGNATLVLGSEARLHRNACGVLRNGRRLARTQKPQLRLIWVNPNRRFEGREWVYADALDLAFQAAPQLVAGADLEKLKLDARAAGVDDEDRVRHGVRP